MLFGAVTGYQPKGELPDRFEEVLHTCEVVDLSPFEHFLDDLDLVIEELLIKIGQPPGHIVEHLGEAFLKGFFPHRALIDHFQDVDCAGLEHFSSEVIGQVPEVQEVPMPHH